jgi:branched-chain amino acid aminotransferase
MLTPQESVATFQDRADLGRSIPFGSNSMQHGTAVFEGIRGHDTVAGPALFRLGQHVDRLLSSATALGIRHGYSRERLHRAILGAAGRAGLAECYVRPVLYTPDPCLGVDLRRHGFTLGVEVWPVSAAGSRPLRVQVSRWCRPSARSFPAGAKATGSYAVSAVARTAAAAAGFDDAVQLDPDSGRVAEGTISNVFITRNGRLFTPWLGDSVLAGITRDTILRLAAETGSPAEERPVEVADLLAADEVFFTGTATGMLAVSSVNDHHTDPAGPVFTTLKSAYEQAVTGRGFTSCRWLSYVPAAGSVRSAS